MAEPASFGRLPDGQSARLCTLESADLRVRITDFGGRIVSIEAPDWQGKRGDVLLGFDDAAQYAAAGGAFGALLGRNANRIAGGDLTIDGEHFRLAANDRGATLHGGPRGFNELLWRIVAAGPRELVLGHVSRDGDQGFPGELAVEARYCLAGAALSLELSARTTKPTVVSLDAHPYFNLAGAASGDVLAHEVEIAAEAFLPTDASQIPTGDILPVAGTPFDFRAPRAIGAHIREADPRPAARPGLRPLLCARRRPRNAAVRGAGPRPRERPRCRNPYDAAGAAVLCRQPLDGSLAGRGGVAYRQSSGFAFEPQGFPDAPHHPNFPSTVLRPGGRYREMIEYRFAAA